MTRLISTALFAIGLAMLFAGQPLAGEKLAPTVVKVYMSPG